MRAVRLLIAFILFGGLTLIGTEFVWRSRSLQRTKTQYAELRHFSYGLFSADEWKKQVSTILKDEIRDLSFTPKTKANLKHHLERELEILIDGVARRLRRKNEKTAKGWIKQSLIDSFVDVKEIKRGIPDYADAMLAELAKPSTQRDIHRVLTTKLNRYMDETFDTMEQSRKKTLVERFGHGDEETARVFLEKKIHRFYERGEEEAWILIGIAGALFLFLGLSSRPLPKTEFLLLTLTLVVLLGIGVTTPMIDLEARIDELSFMLFNHEVSFEDQILFFQSKSILDVFRLMIHHPQFKMNFVGVLLITFSVIFPVTKLFSSLLYYTDALHARRRRLIRFFVEKSGKWSMADVLVVAIFMAYIGFNGIVDSQLKKMRQAQESIDVITTNGTQLQPGYYIFLAYALLALWLSHILVKQANSSERP